MERPEKCPVCECVIFIFEPMSSQMYAEFGYEGIWHCANCDWILVIGNADHE